MHWLLATRPAHFNEDNAWETWSRDWQARLSRETGDPAEVMHAANPVLIPRNHQIEAMIEAAVAGDFAPFHRMNAALAQPFEDSVEYADLSLPPKPDERVLQTYCGT